MDAVLHFALHNGQADRGILQVEVLYQSLILATAEYIFPTVSYVTRLTFITFLFLTVRKQSREKDTPELGLPLLDQQENKNGKHP